MHFLEKQNVEFQMQVRYGLIDNKPVLLQIVAGRWTSDQPWHYDDVIMGVIASQITSVTIVYSIVYSGTDQRKHQSSASLAFVWEIHRGPVNSPQKGPVTRKMFPFDDVTMIWTNDGPVYWHVCVIRPHCECIPLATYIVGLFVCTACFVWSCTTRFVDVFVSYIIQ